MKWIDRKPIEGLLYEDPEAVVFDLDRVARPPLPSDSALSRLWHWLLADLRHHVYESRACASQGWPTSWNRRYH